MTQKIEFDVHGNARVEACGIEYQVSRARFIRGARVEVAEVVDGVIRAQDAARFGSVDSAARWMDAQFRIEGGWEVDEDGNKIRRA